MIQNQIIMLFTIVKFLCIAISAWWIVAVVADLLYIFFTHDPTSVTSFICNPFCIISVPMLDLKMYQGALWWLAGLGVVVITAIFFV